MLGFCSDANLAVQSQSEKKKRDSEGMRDATGRQLTSQAT